MSAMTSSYRSDSRFLSETQMGVEPKIGKHPKMDGENNGKPY